MTYQDRYLAHQGRKKKMLKEIVETHYSERVFLDDVVPDNLVLELVKSVYSCPSSCDRHGIYTKIISTRDDKNLLGGLLVGGTGWIHRSSHIILLFADPEAYKENLIYMPFLDAGLCIMNMYIKLQELNLKGCYCNPQVRGENQIYFRDRFGHDIYCGAMGVGYGK